MAPFMARDGSAEKKSRIGSVISELTNEQIQFTGRHPENRIRDLGSSSIGFRVWANDIFTDEGFLLALKCLRCSRSRVF
jgi:hypothetical protein